MNRKRRKKVGTEKQDWSVKYGGGASERGGD